MEDELRQRVPHTGNTRVVCRTGDPGTPGRPRPGRTSHGARSIIVLPATDGDAGVVKAVLAVRSFDRRLRTAARRRRARPTRGHAETLRTLTDGAVVTVQADAVISQVTAQACHQDGLAAVFRDLLDFDGDEMHIRAVPELVGHTYARGAARLRARASVIGVCRDGVGHAQPGRRLRLRRRRRGQS